MKYHLIRCVFTPTDKQAERFQPKMHFPIFSCVVWTGPKMSIQPIKLFCRKTCFYTGDFDLDMRQVQKSDRINSDCQPESDQLGSTQIISDHEKKNIKLTH